MTIEIPEDVARGLEAIAAAQRTTVEKVAIERLRSLLEPPTSPAVLLRRFQSLPHPSAAAADDLEAAIAEGRLPVHDEGVFDRLPHNALRAGHQR